MDFKLRRGAGCEIGFRDSHRYLRVQSRRTPPRRFYNGVAPMQTPMEIAKLRGSHPQPAPAPDPSERRATPAATVSTAALGIGLAHFIHEINNPLQLIQFSVSLMDMNRPKADGCGGPYMDKVFQELKGGVEQLISLVTSLHSQLKSLWMIDPVFAAVN